MDWVTSNKRKVASYILIKLGNVFNNGNDQDNGQYVKNGNIYK
uniref:Uncharacterized protein n=1 Tax=viral metagenome TaxID=1070528 RepID=A0A6C0LTV1_9ZZZZ